MNISCFGIYNILLETVWWALSNASLIMWIHPAITVIQSSNIKKIIEGSRINDIIYYGNSILVLWRVYVLYGRIVVLCTQTIVYGI